MKEYQAATALQPYVRRILHFQSDSSSKITELPFFADGFPGIIWHQAENGLVLMPEGKLLSTFFLYGQTLSPIALRIRGRFQLSIFQLHPFVSQWLFGIVPKELNDDCYDLTQLEEVKALDLLRQLDHRPPQLQIDRISDFLGHLISRRPGRTDPSVQLAVQLIIEEKGVIPIKRLRERLSIAERAFERRFMANVGVTPKQFAKIIQFQSCLNQISEENYSRLLDVVYQNGFADQSHFIREFKKYTGKTPTDYQKSISYRH